jgi:hypothetical protein
MRGREYHVNHNAFVQYCRRRVVTEMMIAARHASNLPLELDGIRAIPPEPSVSNATEVLLDIMSYIVAEHYQFAA